jgi:hypothetical protein
MFFPRLLGILQQLSLTNSVRHSYYNNGNLYTVVSFHGGDTQ